MDTTGLSASEIKLCRQLYMSANSYWICKDDVIAGTGKQRSVNTHCIKLKKTLAAVGDSANFHLIVTAERIMCSADLKHFQNLQEIQPDDFPPDGIMGPLREGVDRMDEINRKLALREENIEAFHRYSSGILAENSGHDAEGLPKDGIRYLLLSHKTRLRNRSTGFDGLGREERSLIQFRKMNIQKAEHLYKAMQREALGIAPKGRKNQDR